MDCTQVLESELEESVAYTYKVKVAELKVDDDAVPIYSGSNRIGRDPEFCSVVFNNMTLSKEHAVIEVENRYSHLIYDLGSKNKTKVGKMLLKPHVRYQLTDKVQIQFGDLVVDYVMLPDEDGKPYAVIEDSDDEIIPGTPAPAKSKDSTSSREESPTIFQMETECPSGYEESCARMVTDQDECEEVPLVENQGTSSAATANGINLTETRSAASGVLVEDEKTASTRINETTDGDETDPEDVFFEMTQKPAGVLALDMRNTEEKEGVENAIERNVPLSEDSSDNRNPFVEKSLQVTHMKSSECENENSTLNSSTLEGEEEDIFCIATQVIVHESKQELEGEKILESTYEEDISGELEEDPDLDLEANDEAQPTTDPVLVDVCSKSDDENAFKIPHAVQRKSTEIAEDAIIVENKKTEKHLESSLIEDAEGDEAAEDGFFNAATQVIETESKDSEGFKEPLPVKNEGFDVEKGSCNTSEEEKITHNDADSQEYDEEDSLYDAGTEVLSNTENKKENSNEVSADMDDKCEQVEGVVQDCEEKQSVVEQEDSDSATDDEGSFILNAPTQVIHHGVPLGEGAQLPEVEKSEPVVEVSTTPCNAENVGEKSDEIDTNGNNRVFEAETQALENHDRNSVDIPSTASNENEEDDKKFVEECDNSKEGSEGKNIVLGKDDAVFDAPTQIINPMKEDSDALDEDESEPTEKNENATGYYVEKQRDEKDANEEPETLESNLEINLKDESICSMTKDVPVCDEDSNSFKVPAAVEKKCVEFMDVSSGITESEEGDTCDPSDEQYNNEPIFEAETQVIEIQKEKSNEEHDKTEDKNNAIFEAETQVIEIQIEKSNEEHDKTEDKNNTIFEAENQVIQAQNEKSCEEHDKTEDKNNTIFEAETQVIEVQNEKPNVHDNAEDKNNAMFEAETQVIEIQNEKSNIMNAFEKSRCKFSGDTAKSTGEKRQESDHCISSDEKSINDTSTSKPPNNIQSSPLNDSGDSIFSAPTQVIITANFNGTDPSLEFTNHDPSSSVLKGNSIKKSTSGDAEKEGEKPIKELYVGNSISAQEIEDDPTIEDEFNDSFFEAPTQIFPSGSNTPSQEEAQDQIKNILNRLEDDDNDEDEASDCPKPTEALDVQDSSGKENAVNDSFFEAATQIVSFSAPEESNSKEEEEEGGGKVIPTSLSRSSSYSSIHDAPTQCIDDLEISGQNLPVVASCVENSKSTEVDKESKDNLERDSRNETLQIRKPLDTSTPAHMNIDLVLPSTQELKKAGQECYGEVSDSETPTTSYGTTSPIVQKRTRKRVIAKRGILITEDVDTINPTGSRVAFSNNLAQPSTSKKEASDGEISEPVVSGCKRRLRISTKTSVKKPIHLEAKSDKNNVEDDKSKKYDPKKSIKKSNELEDVLSGKKEEGDDKTNKMDDQKNIYGGRNKTMKRFSSRQRNTEASYDTENGRPSRQRKMTWKARENCEENHSPDSKGKKDEKKESPNVSPSPSSKSKSHESSSSDVIERRNKRVPGRSLKGKTSSGSSAKSKPAESAETSEDSNVLHKRKKMIDTVASPAHKDTKADLEKKAEPKRSKRNTRAASSSKPEAKAGLRKEQTTLEKWCESPGVANKQRRSNSNSSALAEKEQKEEPSAGSRAKHSDTLNSSDSSGELKTRNSRSKRKQNVDVSETPKKQRRTRITSSSDQDVENKPVLPECLVEMNNFPDSNTELKVRISSPHSKRKQNANNSDSLAEKKKTVGPLEVSLGDEKVISPRGRSRRSVRESDSSSTSAELKSLESQNQDEKKENSQISDSINRRKTTRSISSSSDQDKRMEETKKGRSKRSTANMATTPEEVPKHKEAMDNKRKSDSKVCGSPQKQRKIGVVSPHEDQPESVSGNSRSKSKRTSGKSNALNSNSESKTIVESSKEPVLLLTSRNRRKARSTLQEESNVSRSDAVSKDADENSQDPVVLSTPRNSRKTRVQSPVVNKDESADVNIKGRSKRITLVGNSEILKQESKTRKSVSLELVTPPRSARSRNTFQETPPSEQPNLKMEQPRSQKRNNKPVQSAESDSSVCGSPAYGTGGRKRKLQLPPSSTESDGQSSQGEGTPKRSSRLKQQVVHCIMFTGVTCSEDDEAVIKKLGGKIVQEPEECTILITDKIRRTLKFLCTMGQGKPIVSPDWLKQSQRTGQFLDPWKFIVKDKEAERKFSFELQKSLKLASSKKLLEGYSIFVTPSVKPPPSEMKGIVENSGGQFLAREPRGKEWPAQSFVISAPNDKKVCAKFKKTRVPIVSPEILLTGILQQKIKVGDYVLKL